ncbi:MAG TPA: hypothetical protein VGD77_17375 [Gemmatimonadaceae bacterium]
MTAQLQPQDHAVRPIADRASMGWYGGASADVAHFVHNLRRIPASTWIALTADAPIPSAVAAPGDEFDRILEEQADHAARRRLTAALESMPAIVRRITRRIDTDLAVFLGIVPEPTIQRMRRTAHLAAFALACKAHLAHDDVVRLYRPFVELIPPLEALAAD